MADKVFQDTTATRKIFQLKKRIRAVRGGTSASKTISILVWLIDYAQSVRNEIVTVVAESVPHLRMGAVRDFQSIMKANGYWNDDRWNETGRYTFPTDTILEFISFDKFSKAHGPRRDVLFLNEANNLPYHVVDQLITRTRKIVWMDWNPSEEFYFDTEMLGKRDDIDFITLTYLDNEALDEVSKQEILSHKHNKEWWTVYGLGQLGTIQGRIYKGWQFIDDIPHEARLERRGLDFGFSNDPTAIVDIYYYNGGYILDELLFQKGLSNKQIADTLLATNLNPLVAADSAEPKSIDEIRNYGVNIIGAPKGKDSVSYGIQLVQDQKISVTNRSLNLKKAYRNYMWMKDKDGNFGKDPDHTWSDLLDATRYGLVTLIKRKNNVPLAEYKTAVKSYVARPEDETPTGIPAGYLKETEHVQLTAQQQMEVYSRNSDAYLKT